MRKWIVYISSTFIDLEQLRSDLITLFRNQLSGRFGVGKIMELMFDNGTFTPFVEDCVQAVRDCDIYIIILGNRTGSYPPGENRTYTEIELDTAIKEKKFIFCIRLQEFNQTQIDDKSKHDHLLKKFEGKPVHYFKDRIELKNCVYECLFPFASKTPINKKNPYKGLEAFSVDDGDNFFGRNEELDLCLKKIILKNEDRFFSIVGDSGIGKTSFVQAGILFRLKNNSQYGLTEYEQIVINPGNEPFSNLQYQLRLKNIDVKDLLEDGNTNKLILFFNQFEEIITQCHTEESIRQRNQLLDFLDHLTQIDFKGIIIATFRSDYSSQLANFHFIRNHQTFFLLSSLDFKVNTTNWETSIKEIIRQPALNNGVIVEDTLVKELVNQTKDVDGLLPILQLTLNKIWNYESIKDGIITSSEYSELSQGKGMSGIIEAHADEVVKRITKGGTDKLRQDILKSILLNLVEVNENSLDVKKTAGKAELLETLKVYPDYLVKEIFEELVNKESRLLIINDGKVNIIHEVLIRKWDRLKVWINERRDALKYQRKIENAIEDYSKGVGKLYKGKKLKTLQNWKAANPDLPSNAIKEFIKKSNAQSRKKTYAIILGSLIIVLAMVTGYRYYLNLKFAQEKEKFISSLKFFPSLEGQVQKLGGNLDSISSFKVDNTNFLLLKEGLRFFKNLDTLWIVEADSLHDLSFLPTLPHLNFLDINSNSHLMSLSGIEKLINLQYLVIYDNDELTNLQGIQNLKNLRYLAIEENLKLPTLKGVEELTKLNYLDVSDNDNLSTIDHCEKFTGLKFLSLISNRRLKSMNGIEQLTGLDSLLIDNNDSLTLDFGIGTLSGLSYLAIPGNTNLSSFNGIETLKDLHTLEISDYHKFINMKGIERMTGLNSLEISFDSSLTDLELEGIERLSNLDSLVIGYNPNLSSLKGSRKLPRILSLVVKSNDKLTDLNGIERFEQLNSLNISSNNGLTSIKALAKGIALRNLEINGNNQLIQLNGIENLIALNSLKISNRLTNLNDIPKLRNLRELEISSNDSLTSLGGIDQFIGLNSLVIAYNFRLKSLEGIQRLDNLRTLYTIDNSSLTSAEAIRQIKGLKKLVYEDSYSQLMKFIYELSGLEELTTPPGWPIDSLRLKSKNPNIKVTRAEFRRDRL